MFQCSVHLAVWQRHAKQALQKRRFPARLGKVSFQLCRGVQIGAPAGWGSQLPAAAVLHGDLTQGAHLLHAGGLHHLQKRCDAGLRRNLHFPQRASLPALNKSPHALPERRGDCPVICTRLPDFRHHLPGLCVVSHRGAAWLGEQNFQHGLAHPVPQGGRETIITIGREYCTGGNYIAEDVANALGIKLYDKELITMAAKHSGLSEEAVAASEKRHTHSLLYSLYTMGNELPLGDQVFILQSRIIKQLAEEGPCVILGRCGDYVLRERKDVLRVFIYAPVEWRRELAKTDPLVKAHDEKGIKEEIEKTDRNRAAYYNYYTQNRWGDAHNYDLAINAALGRETCVKMILDAVAAKEKTMETAET